MVTTGSDGEPLTAFSNSCAFCNLVLSSETGRRGCVASWQRLATQEERQRHPAPSLAACHAGLQYARARIELGGELAAMLIAGQFYAEAPVEQEEQERIKRLAEKYGIDPEALCKAALMLRSVSSVSLPVPESSLAERLDLGHVRT